MDQPSSQRRKGIARLTLRAAILFLTADAGFAQSPSGPPASPAHPAYEVAAVRINTVGRRSSTTETPDQITCINESLKSLIERAYNVQPFQVDGPAWLDSVHVDINAKYPPTTRPEVLPLMLRALLEDRFSLGIHRETRVLPGYTLVLAKGGLKLKPTGPGEQQIDSWGWRVRTISAQKASMSALADEMTDSLGQIVIDKTGLKEVYDFELRWARDDSSSDASDAAPALFTVLNTLGLRLQRQKFPTETIVVDHMERTPTEN